MFHTSKCFIVLHMCMSFDDKRIKLDPKVEKCIFIGYCLERKQYTCFKFSTWKLQVIRICFFYEITSQYSLVKVTKDVKARNGDVSSNVEHQSQLISEPQKSFINGSNNIPWKIILKSPNITHGNVQTSFGNIHVDGEANDSQKCVEKKS